MVTGQSLHLLSGVFSKEHKNGWMVGNGHVLWLNTCSLFLLFTQMTSWGHILPMVLAHGRREGCKTGCQLKRVLSLLKRFVKSWSMPTFLPVKIQWQYPVSTTKTRNVKERKQCYVCKNKFYYSFIECMSSVEFLESKFASVLIVFFCPFVNMFSLLHLIFL